MELPLGLLSVLPTSDCRSRVARPSKRNIRAVTVDASPGWQPHRNEFGLSPSYGILTARDTHDWFLLMMRSHDEFVVETDVAGEWPMPFWSGTVRQVVVE